MSGKNHFSVFGLPCQFEIDLTLLDSRYRKLQNEVHPDKYVNATPSERLASAQTSALVNEAYQTLKQPASRACYLLNMQGIDPEDERNTAMPAEFLMTQMEWREMMNESAQSKNMNALDLQRQTIRKESQSLQQQLAQQMQAQPEQGALTVRKLSFIDKASADINDLINQLLDL